MGKILNSIRKIFKTAEAQISKSTNKVSIPIKTAKTVSPEKVEKDLKVYSQAARNNIVKPSFEIVSSKNIVNNGQVTGKIVKMLRDGHLETWYQYGHNNILAQKFGLNEVIREYSGAKQDVASIKKVTMSFSPNKFMGEVKLTGTPKEVGAIWNAITHLATDPISTLKLLSIYR